MPDLDKDVEQRFDKEMRVKFRKGFYPEDLDFEEYYEDIKQFLAKELAAAEKSYGGCRKCYGKGYSTYHKPGNTASTDLPDAAPIRRVVIEKPKRDISFCSCQRGQDLKKELAAAKEEGAREERKKLSKLIDHRKNNIDACGFGDCDDSVWAELDELQDQLTTPSVKEKE